MITVLVFSLFVPMVLGFAALASGPLPGANPVVYYWVAGGLAVLPILGIFAGCWWQSRH